MLLRFPLLPPSNLLLLLLLLRLPSYWLALPPPPLRAREGWGRGKEGRRKEGQQEVIKAKGNDGDMGYREKKQQ
eukprot:6434782-Pyramimonas_sp.AAC.1